MNPSLPYRLALALSLAATVGSTALAAAEPPPSPSPQLAAALPALRNPTVSPLSNPEWIAVETIIDARQAREFAHQEGVRQPVKPVSPNSLRLVAARQWQHRGYPRHELMKCSVETGSL